MDNQDNISPQDRLRIEAKFVRIFAILAGLFAALPTIVGFALTPAGFQYSGFQYNFDDHMVYAAWMRQAMDGHFLFENRFTTDAQPGLTVHLYFWALGQVARFTGIAMAAALARIGLSVLAVFLLYRLIQRLDWSIHSRKMAIALAVLGGGIGFLLWQNFGVDIAKPTPDLVRELMLGRLPVDIWQPELMFATSALTNSLFMAAICLILYIFDCVLESETTSARVLPGAIAMAVLMNIHSYDVVIVGITMFGLMIAMWARDRVTSKWFLRCLGIGLGAIPSALWFLYVLRQDPVFQARAATETFSPNFRAVIFGLLPLIALAVPMLLRTGLNRPRRPLRAVIMGGILFGALFIAASYQGNGFFLNWVWFGACLFVAILVVYQLAGDNSTRNLLISWAVLGVVGLYLPMLFQRKLAMGLEIPWAVLAAGGTAILLAKQERSARNLATTLAVLVLAATSTRWLIRETELMRLNVSNTTMHTVYYSPDTQNIIKYFNDIPGRKTVVAMPGVAMKGIDQERGEQLPDSFLSPLVPDLNPVLTGLTGAYTYAGHWSETPHYDERRKELTRIYVQPEDLSEKLRRLKSWGVDYLVMPEPASFPELPLVDLSPLGEKVLSSTQFSVIKLP